MWIYVVFACILSINSLFRTFQPSTQPSFPALWGTGGQPISSCLALTGTARRGNANVFPLLPLWPAAPVFSTCRPCVRRSLRHKKRQQSLSSIQHWSMVKYLLEKKKKDTLGRRSLFAEMWCLITTVVEVATNVVLFTWVPSISHEGAFQSLWS